MNGWFRSHHGAPMDPKWIVVAQRSGASRAEVVAVFWALLDHASRHRDRGSVEGFDVETVSAFLDVSSCFIEKIMESLAQKKVIENGRLAAWGFRQFEGNSTARVRAYRERMKRVTVTETRGNARNAETATDTDTDTDTDKKTLTRVLSKTSFDSWWEGYPDKVGKGAARKAFERALTKTSLDQLTVGVERYKQHKPVDRQWCHPATWLNEERWNDQFTNGHDAAAAAELSEQKAREAIERQGLRERLRLAQH
jgi:hypothetical protein